MDDAEFYRERGFGGTAGFGRRPALLVIDLVNGFTDPASPLGSDLDSVVAATRRLIDACRAKGVPIIFTTVAFDGAKSQAAAVFMAKIPRCARSSRARTRCRSIRGSACSRATR